MKIYLLLFYLLVLISSSRIIKGKFYDLGEYEMCSLTNQKKFNIYVTIRKDSPVKHTGLLIINHKNIISFDFGYDLLTIKSNSLKIQLTKNPEKKF